MKTGRVKVSTFSGIEVGNYKFRRSSFRVSCPNLQIKSYQLLSASSGGAASGILNVLRVIESEMAASVGGFFGIWYAIRWELDTPVSRRIGRKRFLSRSGQQSIQFCNTGVVEREGEILHWGDLDINDLNFAQFSAEISFNENGAIFVCDSQRWGELRARIIGQLAEGGGNKIPCLSHPGLVELALSQGVAVIIVSNWIEDDVIDFDLFTTQASYRLS